jgi:hypothetical protein
LTVLEMSKYVRFGARRVVPSTLEKQHALMAHRALEAHRARWAAEEGMPANAKWDDIVERRSLRLGK